MPDLSKLDWLASWQNGVSLVAGIVVAVWLGPLDAAHFTFVLVVTMAVVRLLTMLLSALAARLWPKL